ncbi:MAG: radical SAM-associated putative lipoprotein [Bacteroidales bacterium]|nr:radical SAM-associated putative lipoprotein [Candidatus Cryptobacteroides caccocaballi]
MKRTAKYLLGLLGFTAMASSCIGRVEYGCPHVDYRISGKVVDGEGVPVAGIEVSTRDGYGQKDTTDVDGKFLINGDDIGCPDRLSLKDVDGVENGLYKSRQAPLGRFTQVEKGDGHWYDGVYESEGLVITVEKEEN